MGGLFRFMASLSKNRNLTINTLTRHLPENLTQYIIYHELAHAKHGKKHNQTFWNTIRKKHPNHNALEKDLLAYWFLIQETETANQKLLEVLQKQHFHIKRILPHFPHKLIFSSRKKSLKCKPPR